MTATDVNGVEVIADQPARSRITRADGSPVFFEQIRLLLLADGSETYGCVHCDYTGRMEQIRPHLNRHRDLKAPARVPRQEVAGIDVHELIRRLRANEGLAKDRDRWRTRALAAEKDVADLRRLYARAIDSKGDR